MPSQPLTSQHMRRPVPVPVRRVTPFTVLYARFKVFDGLRAISILWVVFHHVPVTLPAWVEPFRHRGFLGVELFFAISGFLVTRSLSQCMDRDVFREKNPLFSTIHDFLVRRVSRIFPAFFLFLLVILPLVYLVDSQYRDRVLAVKDTLWSFPVFLSNYLIPLSKNTVPHALSNTWSLSFEEQFYLSLLVMFVMGGRRLLPHLIFVTGIASMTFRILTISFLETPLTFQAVQMPLHLRFDALMWACLAWLYYEKLSWLWSNPRRAGIVNFTIFVGVVTSVTLTTWFPSARWQGFVYCLTPPFFALMVRALCELKYQESWIVKALSSPLMVAIGIVSYEIYLIHALLIGFLGKIGLKSYPLVFTGVALLTSFIVGWVYHQYYSKPVEQWMRIKFSPKI